jgi:hypothetical protein
MGRRLAALAAAALFALAFSVTSVLAAGQADHWVVVQSDSTDIAGLGPIACGDNSYTVTSGTSEFLWRMKGDLDGSGVALTPGRAIETWTLVDTRAVDQDGVIHRVVGRQRVEATWLTGANLDGSGPYTNFSFVLNIHIQGTADGHSMALHQVDDGPVHGVDTGTCSGLTFYQ